MKVVPIQDTLSHDFTQNYVSQVITMKKWVDLVYVSTEI